MTTTQDSQKNGNRQAKEQLKIPLTKDEVKQLESGDHIKVRFSDDSPHKEMILFKDGDTDE